MKLIDRKQYLQELVDVVGTPDISRNAQDCEDLRAKKKFL